jgi:hypothetical protein
MSNFKKLSLAGALAAGLTLVGCFSNEATGPAPDLTLKVSTTVDAVNKPAGGLAKSNAITLAKLVIELTSNASTPDTVRDTILAGTQGFSSNASAEQTVTKAYTVKGLRTWTVTATVYDTKDSVIHQNSAVTSTFVRVADTAAVSLNLASRFTMYRAIFASKPDSITTSAGTGHKQEVKYKRLVLKIDDVIVRDTTHATFFAPNTPDTLSWDYVPSSGNHTVRLIAYGSVGETYNDSLFAGSWSITGASGGVDTVASFSLNWVGPNTGVEAVSVTIGKVGTTTVTGGGYCGAGCVPKGK